MNSPAEIAKNYVPIGKGKTTMKASKPARKVFEKFIFRRFWMIALTFSDTKSLRQAKIHNLAFASSDDPKFSTRFSAAVRRSPRPAAPLEDIPDPNALTTKDIRKRIRA